MSPIAERKQLFANISDKELKYLSKKMKDNYLRVKRINFEISESYLKDCRAIELILMDRYDSKQREVSV